MRREQELGLSLLGQDFVLVTDAEWSAFLERLWRPFVSPIPQQAQAIFVTPSAGAWQVTCGWHPLVRQRDPWIIANEIRHLMVERALELTPSVVGIHAAAVARDERLLVLCGESGVGKTTLTLELCARGWGYVTDDLVAIGNDGKAVAFPKPLGIKESAEWARYAEHWSGSDWPGRPSDLFLIPPDALGWLDADQRLKPTEIALLARGDDRTDELSPGEAVTELWNYARPRVPDSLSVLAGVCGEAVCVRVTSSSVESALAAVEGLVDAAR